MAWTGVERREQSQKDHDTLTTMVQILNSHVNNFDAHTAKDEKNFENVNTNLYKLNRAMWIAMGVISALEVGLRVLGK